MVPILPGFSVAVANDDHRVIAVSGDVDLEHADDLAAFGLQTLRSLDGTRDDSGAGLIIDLADVSFIDSTGLAALVKIRNAADAQGRRVTLRGLPPRVFRVLAITHLTEVFDIMPLDAGRV